jgi:hypothetical protein
MKKLIIFTITATMLISCEGNTNQEYIIINNSSSVITVKYNLKLTGEDMSEEISNGSAKAIHEHDYRGGRSEASDISSAFTNFHIVNATNDTCQKDASTDGNWNVQIVPISRIPSAYEHDYTFSVDDTNF